jgi:hypothetical protein
VQGNEELYMVLVSKMIRKSDGKAKHTSSMFGVAWPADDASLASGEGNAMIANFATRRCLFLLVLVTAHAQEPLKVDTKG